MTAIELLAPCADPGRCFNIFLLPPGLCRPRPIGLYSMMIIDMNNTDKFTHVGFILPGAVRVIASSIETAYHSQ
jgi:hypothetical protein